MTAHIFFPAIAEKEDLPATLSWHVLTGLLREEMGFTGLIITDCMEMKAIVDNFGTTRGPVQAIAAGSDMLLISHDYKLQVAAIRVVIEAVRAGIINEERINSAVGRILSLKKKITPGNGIKKHNPGAGGEIAREIAARGITVVEDPNHLIPFSGEKLVIMEYLPSPGDKRDSKQTPAEKMAATLGEYKFSIFLQSISSAEDIKEFSGAEQVLFCSYSAWKDPAQINLIQIIAWKNPNFAVAAFSSSYDARIIPSGNSFITSFDTSPYSLQALAEVLAGRLNAAGRLLIKYRKDGKNS